MDATMLSSLPQLSDQELLARVTELAADEREVTALLIAHLAELDARRLYLAEGCSSLFTYCTQVLQLSEHAAYGRIEAARAARKLPILLEMLAEGSLTLTTVGLLAPHLTAENHRKVLDMARHQSKRAVEELIAGLSPQRLVPTVVRRLPPPRHHPTAPALPDGPPTATATAQRSGPSAMVTPLTPQRYRVQFTARAETCEKLRRVQAFLRHQIPDGDLDRIVDRALTALLEKLAREKLAATERPRVGRRTAPGSRHIPAEVKRAVWFRDGGRCSFVGANGRCCSEVGFLEFHHVKPYAAGGESTVYNIQLRCRAHNVYEADLHFGPRDSAGVGETRARYSVRTELGTMRQQELLNGRLTHESRTFVPQVSIGPNSGRRRTT